MEGEFKTLEEKISQFVALCRRLRTDNRQLRQQLAMVANDNKRLNEKIGAAKNDLENLLAQIPENEP
jgi:septal ring factor EnvC (AmiA/AmiB activator)